MTDLAVSTNKRNIRKQLTAALAQLGKNKLRRQSIIACEHLCDTQEFRDAKTIMIFLSLPDEIDTTVVMERAWQADKQVVVPYTVRETRRMIPMLLASLESDMGIDDVGIRCPASLKPIATTEIDLVVVPGLGFDDQGRRLGRGGGFYDRFLAADSFAGRTCALALQCQVIPQVPTNHRDVSIEMLVTDKGVKRFYK